MSHNGGVITEVVTPDYLALIGDSDQRDLWRRMCARAVPHLEGFWSDLLHDWATIRGYWNTEGFEFYFGVRSMGTTCTADEEFLRQDMSVSEHLAAWKVTVTFRDGVMRDVVFTPWEG